MFIQALGCVCWSDVTLDFFLLVFFGRAEVEEVSHIYLSSPSSFRALGVRVAEGKNACVCVFACVCEFEGFTTLLIFERDPPQCNH